MKPIWMIAAEEWRYWFRSRLILVGALLFILLLVATSVMTALEVTEQRHARMHQQTDAENTFLAQPDRHPHRMVHYGHYVFRAPPPLAMLDPGLEPVTGQSIFLEGHKQNSAMFADSASSADLSGLSSLTPAVVYQLLAPLLLILMGHGALVREREAATLLPILAQGISGLQLLAGKALALLSLVVVLLAPTVLMAYSAVTAGERLLALLTWTGAYFIYLSVWALAILCASFYFVRRSSVLSMLLSLWLILTLALPALALSVISSAQPASGKIETDLDMLADLRALGDGHNANDPAFAALREELLREHKVDNVEALPVNFRGIVAQYAEEKLSTTLNAYADAQMATETQQAQYLQRFGWISPALAISQASRAIAATDLAHHHRFLREAEQLRYDFVQGLNRIHAQELAFSDDIKRSSDPDAERRTRVSAEHWQVLDRFQFNSAALGDRIREATSGLLTLAFWLLGLSLAAIIIARRVKP